MKRLDEAASVVAEMTRRRFILYDSDVLASPPYRVAARLRRRRFVVCAPDASEEGDGFFAKALV